MNVALIEAAITEKTKAIVPVHFTGYMTDMRRVMEIAKKYDLVVVEDAVPVDPWRHPWQKGGYLGVNGCFFAASAEKSERLVGWRSDCDKR